MARGLVPNQADVRAAMLDAAAKVFARKGFSGAKISEIAHEAGYTAPALYKYFAGKEQIFEALVLHAIELVERHFAELPAVRPSLPEEVEFLVDATFELLERHARVFLTISLIHATAEFGAPRRWLEREMAARATIVAVLTERLRKAAGGHRIGEIDVEQAVHVLEALCFGMFFRWAPSMVYGRGGSLRDQAPLVARIFLRGVGPS